MTTAAPPIHELSLLSFVKQRLRDQKNELFSDQEYETYLWRNRITCSVDRTTLRATRSESTDMFFYPRCSGLIWRVEVQDPTADQSYVVNEAALMIFNPEGGETADTLTIKGYPVSVAGAVYDAMMDAANDPAKCAIYLMSNGFTSDTRDGARMLREQAQHILLAGD